MPSFIERLPAVPVSALVLAAGLALGCNSTPGQPVRVFAAASTREALEEIAAKFRDRTGIPVELNFAASSALARQIEYGAGADLFLSADEAWADYLAGKNLVDKRRDLLSNQLVVVVSAQSRLNLRALADLKDPSVSRLALGGSAVPAGRYAREALQHAGIWESIKDRVIEGADVRGALNLVRRGEAEAGIVYASDVVATSEVRVALEIKPDLHSPIRYPLVLVRQPVMKPGAVQLYEFLGTDDAMAIFRKFNFGSAHQ
jgi:molybdate transport system substrate-binding protein